MHFRDMFLKLLFQLFLLLFASCYYLTNPLQSQNEPVDAEKQWGQMYWMYSTFGSSSLQCTAIDPTVTDTTSNLNRLSSSAGSCDVSGRSICIDYSTDYTVSTAQQDCNSSSGGSYSNQTCATRNAALTRTGLCVLTNIGYAASKPSDNAVLGASYYSPAYSTTSAKEHCKQRFECTEAVNATFSEN